MVEVTVIRKQKHNTKKGLVKGYLRGLEESLVVLEGQAKDNSPYDTGFLRASIKRGISGTEGKVFTRTFYAIFQEKIANHGKGYFKPAAQFLRTKLTAIFGRAIRSEIRSN